MIYYLNILDLQARIPAAEFMVLFDRDQDGQADAAVLDAAMTDAESYVHGFLAGRYVVPLDTSDQVTMSFIMPILVDLAWQAGHLRPDMVSDELAARISSHEKRLADIRDGRAKLPMTTQPSVIRYTADQRKFQSMP